MASGHQDQDYVKTITPLPLTFEVQQLPAAVQLPPGLLWLRPLVSPPSHETSEEIVNSLRLQVSVKQINVGWRC